MLSMLGDYAKRAAPELLMVSNTDRHPTERADLFGARFVASIEIEAGRKLAEVLVKDMTGGDRIKARWLYHDFFEWEPTHKLFLAANHKPTIRGTDHAIWRRILLIPFAVTIPEQERDRQLGEKLKEELPGILRWAVEGCLEWQSRGLDAPDSVRAATASYRDESDILAEFLDAECVLDSEAATPASELYHRYVGWSERIKDQPISKAAFGQHLSERGLEATRTKSLRMWRGIRFRGPGDTGDEDDTAPGETPHAHAGVGGGV